MSWVIPILTLTLVLVLMMSLLWVLARRIHNYALVDVGWSYSFAVAMTIYLLTTGVYGPRALALSGLVILWSLRLGSHLYVNRIHNRPEEGRYQTLRQNWKNRPGLCFFVFYQAQALSVVVLSLPFLLTLLDPDQRLGWLGMVAIALAVISVVGESLADLQLQRFIAQPANRGRVCDQGLWSWSRHPNYFFESLIWVAFALFALPAPLGWLGLISPLTIWYLIIRVTGIPPTEAQCLKSRGEAYRDYQQRTSAFFPLPPKR